MIEQLRIKNLGVIRDAVLDFSPGLTVLTGETGAGKTMVFRSLHLLFGGKADSSLVSTGADQASVEADVVLPELLVGEVRELGGELDEVGAVIFSRQVNANGRTRSFLGGASVPAGVVGDFGEQLVAVHGQSDQRLLAKPEQQRILLDRYAGTNVSVPLEKYTQLWDEVKEIDRRLSALTTDSASRLQELEHIIKVLAVVEELKPEPGEDNALNDEASRLVNSESLHDAVATAKTALVGDEMGNLPASVQAENARKALEHESGSDSALGHLAIRVREIEILIADVSSDLSGYLSQLDSSPSRLAYVESRRAALKQASREFGDVDALLEWVAQNKGRLDELAGGDEVIAELNEKRNLAMEKLQDLAAVLTQARSLAAEQFSVAVSGELESLAMAGASVQFQISQGQLTRNGADTVALGLISRPGSPWIPIAKGASGGELSRIMLAVEVVLAAADPTDTFVFDEVDAGVGGQAAVEVGRRLARLARNAQVIVVTHLPQVAAFADSHLVISRAQDDEFHSSQVNAVAHKDRVGELSRMLAGLTDSLAGSQLAQELLDLAELERRHAIG